MTTNTGWSIEGTDLRTLAYDIETVNGWDSWPGKRGIGVSMPFMHGAYTDPHKYYNPREFALSLVLLPTTTTGTVTHTEGRHAHIRDNIDTILGLLHKNTLLSVIRTEPAYPGAGTVQREALCEAIDVIPVQSYRGALPRMLVARFIMPSPFWRELPVESELAFTTGNIITGGNAPIHDMVINFQGHNGVQRLTVDDSGDYLEVDADTTTNDVIVDVGARTVTQSGSNVDDVLTFNRGHWMEWAPNDATYGLTLTGTGSVDLSWYNKWF